MAAVLGEALTGIYPIPGGTAQLFERGVVVTGAAGPVAVEFAFPMIGRPHIATDTASAGTATALRPEAVTFRRAGHDISVLGPLVRAALAGRVAVVPTGQASAPQVLTAGPVEIVEPERPTGVGGTVVPAVYGVSLTGPLRERQLYDVALAADPGGWRIVAPHAVYHRRVWHDFGIAHVTDAHVARRIDRFRPTLYNLGRPEAAARMYNWNDRFRGFVRYANYLHATGALDVILATGDLYDYQFEYDDGNGQGNALFLRNLILGRAPGPDFPDVEELRVPIFMVPGNHDYRMHPYHLIFDLDFVGHHRFTTYENYHMQSGDALALWTGLYGGVEDGVPDLDVGSTARMVEIDPGLRPYREALADRGSYVVRLGAHRIVMLDSAHDVGVLTSGKDALREYFGFVSENEHTFAGGSPNCEGVSDTELKLAADALAGTADDGLFILGIHAPLFNLWSNELPYFLRQTQRPAQPGQDVGFLARHGRKPLPGTEAEVAEFVKKEWRLWFPGDHDHRDAVFVKRGGTQDLLDYGVSRGRSEDLLRLLAGIGSRRPADVVLSGHTHRHNEFVVHTTGAGELAFYMDFYTTNPLMYYPASYLTGYRSLSSGKLTTNNDVTYVEVDSEATGDATPWPMPYAAAHAKQLQVPPYPDPLSHSQDPRAWWAAHRPLVLQTGALGPMENNQVSFSGFRLLSVKGDVIDKVHSISINRLEANGYRLSLEDAARPAPPRRHRHSERSRRHHAPDAESKPAAIWLPQLGVSNVTYRDTQDRLHELWKNTADSGASNLTGLAGAPAAASDPSPYFDAADRQLVVIYRDSNGKVYSLFWSTGPVGYNLLTPQGAARADGNPVGYFDAAGIHHVIYRSSDRHLHELWWAGAGAVGYRDLTQEASAPLAVGDPSPYVDTRRGERVVIYRGTDNQVYSLYWTNGPVDYSKLSESVHAPTAKGDPAGYYTAHDDVHQVVYRGTDDHLYELYWVGTGGVNPWNLTAIAGAPRADGDPAVYYSAGTDTKHVIYRSADAHLNELWWVPGVTGPSHVDLSVFSLAPPAVGRPAAFTIDGTNSQHAIYRGTDNQIHEISWT